jgi:Asp-tRNA(Asn)/Glu-tRNA(Gln) amidotransferase A subunit family amidase
MTLAETIDALRDERLELEEYLVALCDRIAAAEPELQALLPEPDRRERLLQDAAALRGRFPDPAGRPPLYGLPVGVKDIFRVDGCPTRAGSRLPPERFAGAEASCVTTLRRAGALILGKTVTTEFAYFAPGPTRNPNRLTHTPGGSSSGSAAAVAAGFCPLALGSQTIGSVIRPAAFCGVAGFKPTYGRVPIDGVIPCAPSYDHVGFFAPGASGLDRVAALLCRDWKGSPAEAGRPPVLGIPEGPYLAQASPEGLEGFERQVARLEAGGCRVLRLRPLETIAAINRRHVRLMAAEMAQVHAEWFAAYETLYHPRTAALIREGFSVSAEEQAAARAGQAALREELETLMARHRIDALVCPAATGPAPEGLDSTGDPCMNLPWTHAGLPVVTLPAGTAENGLPLGLQCIAASHQDEGLLALALRLERCLREGPG